MANETQYIFHQAMVFIDTWLSFCFLKESTQKNMGLLWNNKKKKSKIIF